MAAWAIIVVGTFNACATVAELPVSASNVEFTTDQWRASGDSRIGRCIFLRGIDANTVFLAARYALRSNDFLIKHASFEHRAVIGYHGLSSTYWNLVAGIYFQEQAQGTAAQVLIAPSRSIAASKEKRKKVLREWLDKLTDQLQAFAKDETHSPITATECE